MRLLSWMDRRRLASDTLHASISASPVVRLRSVDPMLRTQVRWIHSGFVGSKILMMCSSLNRFHSIPFSSNGLRAVLNLGSCVPSLTFYDAIASASFGGVKRDVSTPQQALG